MVASSDQEYSNLQIRRRGLKLWFKQLPITMTPWSSQVLLLKLIALKLCMHFEGQLLIHYFYSKFSYRNFGEPWGAHGWHQLRPNRNQIRRTRKYDEVDWGFFQENCKRLENLKLIAYFTSFIVGTNMLSDIHKCITD